MASQGIPSFATCWPLVAMFSTSVNITRVPLALSTATMIQHINPTPSPRVTSRPHCAMLPPLSFTSPTFPRTASKPTASTPGGGATALLVAGIDETAIRALGHWKSDAIFLYLHTQPSRLTSNYARSMLSHGQYTFSPSTTDYDDKDLLPCEASNSLATTLCAVDH
jgi:hypothetical protein